MLAFRRIRADANDIVFPVCPGEFRREALGAATVDREARPARGPEVKESTTLTVVLGGPD
jgi:hypothetical protein